MKRYSGIALGHQVAPDLSLASWNAWLDQLSRLDKVNAFQVKFLIGQLIQLAINFYLVTVKSKTIWLVALIVKLLTASCRRGLRNGYVVVLVVGELFEICLDYRNDIEIS